MKLYTSILSLLIGLNCWCTEPISVQIVPASSANLTGNWVEYGRAFYVVLTNTSDKTYAVWGGDNSWSEGNISFDLIDSTGCKFHIARKVIPRDSNYPVPFSIGPNRHHVIEVILDDSWDGFPKGIASQAMRMRAVLEIKKNQLPVDASTGKIDSVEHIWIGKKESEFIQTHLEFPVGTRSREKLKKSQK